MFMDPRAKLIAALIGALVVLLLIAGAGWKGYRMGASHVRALWAQQKAEMAAEHALEVARLERVSREVVVKYLPKVEYIQGRTKTITKEVPVYVTAEDDRRCTIPAGFVSLHDRAAAESDLPADSPAAGADGAASPVALSAVAGTVAENYGTCHETAARLTALQEWVRGVSNQRAAK